MWNFFIFEKYASWAFQRTISRVFTTKINEERCVWNFQKIWKFPKMVIFGAKNSKFSSKYDFFAIFENFQNFSSQWIIVENTREMVRLKAYDLYFSKIKKFFILPQSPLISARIEEGHFLKFLKMLKIAIFTIPQSL